MDGEREIEIYTYIYIYIDTYVHIYIYICTYMYRERPIRIHTGSQVLRLRLSLAGSIARRFVKPIAANFSRAVACNRGALVGSRRWKTALQALRYIVQHFRRDRVLQSKIYCFKLIHGVHQQLEIEFEFVFVFGCHIHEHRSTKRKEHNDHQRSLATAFGSSVGSSAAHIP